VPSAVPRPGESLADLFPDVAAEWHPTKNGEIAPIDLIVGSTKKVWWKCEKGPDHEWSAAPRTRVQGHGCPSCAGQKVSVTNSLATRAPETAAEWHPTKNGDLAPADVASGSRKKIWWICDKGPDHEWFATVASRTSQGVGCPYCSHNKLSVTNSLQALFPETAMEWHPTKNGNLTPADVVAGSAKRVWWVCNKGPDHEWSTQVDTRTSQGVGCPYCAGRKASVTNSLQAQFPDVAADWHPTKNGSLSPGEVVAGSTRKVWWKCEKGPDHEWQSVVRTRTTRGTGCGFCSGRKLSVTNSLQALFPEIAAEWHPTKNGDLTPDQIVAGLAKKFWWKCDEADDHEWIAVVYDRTLLRHGCPCCSHQKLSVTNSLATVFPLIAAQWHPTKNGDLAPTDVIAGSGKKYWWKCDVVENHEWSSVVHNRTFTGRGCPHCTLTPRSAQEMRLAHELSALVNFDLDAHKVRFAGRLRDVDIVLDDLRLIVEFDGNWWHRNKIDKDRDKTALMEEAGWQVIRVRERPLDSIHANDVMVEAQAPAKTVADLVLNKIVEVTGTKIPRLDEYLASEGPWRDAEALKAIRAYQAERAAKKAARAKKKN